MYIMCSAVNTSTMAGSPSKAECDAARTLGTLSLKHKPVESTAFAFLAELKASLSPEEYKTFIKAMYCVMESKVRADVNFTRGVALLDRFPALCEKFMLFFNDSFGKRRRLQISLNLAPARLPVNCFINVDILGIVVPHVPYMSLGHMRSTCKWMRKHVTAEQVKTCIDRAEGIIGKVTAVPDQRFGVMFKIFNLKEDSIEIGLYHVDSRMIVCRFKGRVFVGGALHMPRQHLLHEILCFYMSSFKKGKHISKNWKMIIQMMTVSANDSIEIFVRTIEGKADARKHEVHSLLMHPYF